MEFFLGVVVTSQVSETLPIRQRPYHHLCRLHKAINLCPNTYPFIVL